jgi:hypothetical protein
MGDRRRGGVARRYAALDHPAAGPIAAWPTGRSAMTAPSTARAIITPVSEPASWAAMYAAASRPGRPRSSQNVTATGPPDRRQAAHSGEAGPGGSTQAIRRVTGGLADLAEKTAAEADRYGRTSRSPPSRDHA